MRNPIAIVIDKALTYIQQEDPSWEEAQPLDFRANVVETLKTEITSSLHSNSRIHWELIINGETFGCMAPMFCMLDWNYNPYLSGLSEAFELKKVQ
jgi:hypothetical protein